MSDGEDEVIDSRMAMLGEPIIGIERVVYDDVTGPGALAARPLNSPKGMSAVKRAIHDLSHLPYDPSCEICVSSRRPNTHHRSLGQSEREIPIMVGDYCFPKHSEEVDPITVLVIRVYPYKLFLCCVVPSKGREPRVVERISGFIKECGLTQFTYRSDREPAIVAMFEDACAQSGRNGTREATSTEQSDEISHAQLITERPEGAMVADVELQIGDVPHVPSTVTIESSHTAAPELSHPGESQSNGLAERSVGIFEDQFRTLKCALEQRLKTRIPTPHPSHYQCPHLPVDENQKYHRHYLDQVLA